MISIPATVAKKVAERLSKYRELEEEGRELAFKRDEVVSYDDLEFVTKLVPVLKEIEDEYGAIFGDRFKAVATALLLAAGRLMNEVTRTSWKERRGEHRVGEELKKALEEVDKAYEQLTGKERCTWLRGVVEPYTLSAAYNDITACYHRLVEIISKALANYKFAERCLIEEGAAKELEEACRAWNLAVERFREGKLYSAADHEALLAHVFDKKAEVRVGSSVGHTTHIDLEKGTLEYYDTDDDVNAVMKRKFEELGLTCELREGEGVRCEGVTPENVKRVFAALAGATSADLRLRAGEAYWIRHPEIRKRCEHLKTPEEREACMINEMLKKALEEELS